MKQNELKNTPKNRRFFGDPGLPAKSKISLGLRPVPGAKRKRKRVGRGNSSGHGTYSGRGSKGQKSRSGNKVRPGFEGGQLPLIKRLPQKRGFVNPFKTHYTTINVGKLNIFAANSEVTLEKLFETGLVKSLKSPVKILGSGNIDRPLLVSATEFSKGAEKKILAAGGRIKRI